MTDIVLKAGDVATNKTDNPALEALSGHGRERSGLHPSQSDVFDQFQVFLPHWTSVSLLVSECTCLLFLHCSFQLPPFFSFSVILSPLVYRKSVDFLHFKQTLIDRLIGRCARACMHSTSRVRRSEDSSPE